MSYYNDASWNAPAPGRQPSWEQPPPPSRSGTTPMRPASHSAPIHPDVGTSSTVNSEVANAYASQFEEVDRAIENLAKSGKPFGPGFPPTPTGAARRESMPMMGGGPRPYPDYDQQRMGGPQRHHSVSEYDGSRSHSASNVQGFYQNQRYAPRPNDADQMAQAKRRMAAQRERELRNYHQEQQYHRNVSGSGSKSDRSMSPNAMNEDERRELIARQHRALYGETSTLYNNNPTSSQDVRVQTSSAGRGPSPLAFDPFGMQAQNAAGEGSVQMPPRDKDAASSAQDARANSTSSPSTTQAPAFNLFDAQQANRTSNSSPGGSPPVPGQKANGSGVAPIGTRPQNQNLQQPSGAAMGKRTNSPLPSPLGYNSYNASEQNNAAATTSASMNPSSTVTDKGVGIWNNGPWSNTPTQGVQASSAPRATSPNAASSGSTTARPASPKPPGGPATVMRRKAAADRAEKTANLRPSSTRAAGAGGSSSTMLRLYTDESPGLKVDPVVVMTLSVVFIFSVVALHVIAKVMRRFSA
ncbi:hypothetical protein GGP41_005513 [Bipolaris sorokiniana]|uniref:Protein transport protein Sec61 subunit beta n=2 Tax=Cochliobolus sativus TaxID=45130 RepID=A0A8H5ZG24_COCSA|nr:uncharacterized protein COCSADRAFT_172112 [Bipolaris sorokiniana ND90Pr]EMD63869.1 hypothetical protein COCSADRAFT_172112 [Bipolaris sorokiniana ND90Pr]KAF5848124.1 hypothetical protein GGP41_005513 [Bipolaris sorokiniana]